MFTHGSFSKMIFARYSVSLSLLPHKKYIHFCGLWKILRSHMEIGATKAEAARRTSAKALCFNSTNNCGKTFLCKGYEIGFWECRRKIPVGLVGSYILFSQISIQLSHAISSASSSWKALVQCHCSFFAKHASTSEFLPPTMLHSITTEYFTFWQSHFNT